MSDEQSKGAFTNMAEKGDTEDYELIDEGGEHMEIDHDHDDSEGGGAVLEPTMTNMNTDMNDTFSEIHHRSSQGGNNFDGDERMDGNSGHNKNIDNSNRFSSPPPHNNRNRFSSPPLQSNNRYSSPAPQNNSNRFGSPPPQNNSNRFSSPPPQNPASDRHHIIEEDDDDDFTSFQNQGDMTGFSEFTADMTMLDKIRRGSTSGGTVGNFEDEETLTVSSAGSYGDTKWSSPAKQPKGELARVRAIFSTYTLEMSN